MSKSIALIAAALVLTVSGTAAQQNKAEQVMAGVRKALGGEDKLNAVKSLSLRGSYQREMIMPAMAGGGRADVMIGGPGGPGAGSPPQVTGELELDIELPSKYIRLDTSTGMMAMTRTEGFDGDRPFAHAAAANPGMRIRIDNPADNPALAFQALQRHRAELARLLLGVLGSTPSSFPVTYSYGGIAEAAEGKAHIVDVKGPDDFAARLFIDTDTQLPLMLTYMAPEPRIVVRTAERGRGGADGEREREEGIPPEDPAPAKVVEHRLFFSDYRDVGGLKLPHRLARGIGQKTSEEWEIKSYRVNPVFKADRFRVS